MKKRNRSQPVGSCTMREGFSSCEVAGVIASGLLRHLKVNNFGFSNFPEIDIDWDDESFHVTFIVDEVCSSTFKLDRKIVKTEVMNFRNNKELCREVFDTIQRHASELECLVSYPS